ncbi:MAG: TrbG/VirB9 family P-type conjugative transfer protein [Erythrobacter sp.]|uniref:TrbG/VirB9 family P-type conjugative transfer protein n=1 Tax=Erythrobacter sp. TaxID=1042 RepID=UPI002607C5F7|nr:TrbG/VirB9 family P-type conjugative transfer protein [Erythrobacter sp.]MDJ0978608.1 TrbG/VirB9 family P-type conjugative transfer protein [Erythrobacter sp.]
MNRAAALLPLTAFAAAALLAPPAFAQDAADAAPASEQAPADPRIQTVIYDEAMVYSLPGKVKVQTTIKFAEDEVIENVAIGDSGAWQVQPNKAQSLLFVKPLAVRAKTNLTVVTSKRTYLFDLSASPSNAPLYVLQFRHPELEKAKEEARLAALEAAAEQEKANALEMAAAKDPYAVADPASLNFEWAGAGTSGLLPARAYDDGEALFLTWPEGTAIPAILITNEDGVEGPVNFTVRGDTVVLDRVPAQIILRSGNETATLTNTGPTIIRPRQAARP